MTSAPPFMGDFSDDDVAWWIDNGVRRQVAAGEAIIRECEPVDHVFVILEGSFTVTSNTITVPLLRTLGPGEIAGEMSYINNQLPLATVRAREDSVVLAVPRSRLDRKIAEDAGFAGRFHKVVSEFTVERLYHWSKKPDPGTPPPEDPGVANMRVYELIEKMLRGEFP